MADTLTIDCLIQAILEAGDARRILQYKRERTIEEGLTSFDYLHRSEIELRMNSLRGLTYCWEGVMDAFRAGAD